MRIGQYTLDNNLMLAPMAGVTDRPFRQLCRRLGAGLAVSEMLSSNPRVWHTAKSMLRMDHSGETGVRSVQIAGADPALMADAARLNNGLVSIPAHAEHYGSYRFNAPLQQDVYTNRNESAILDAYKANPYTQPLTSY